MDKDLEKLKNIFLSDEDMDEETYADNLSRINEWETSIRENTDFAAWQESDISQSIMKQAKETYRELAMMLVIKRDLTQEQRMAIYAKQDAAIWLVYMIGKDAKQELKTIHNQIKMALKVE